MQLLSKWKVSERMQKFQQVNNVFICSIIRDFSVSFHSTHTWSPWPFAINFRVTLPNGDSRAKVEDRSYRKSHFDPPDRLANTYREREKKERITGAWTLVIQFNTLINSIRIWEKVKWKRKTWNIFRVLWCVRREWDCWFRSARAEKCCEFKIGRKWIGDKLNL